MSNLFEILNFRNRAVDQIAEGNKDLTFDEISEFNVKLDFLKKEISDLFNLRYKSIASQEILPESDVSLNLYTLNYDSLVGVFIADKFLPGILTLAAYKGLTVTLDNFNSVIDIRILELIKNFYLDDVNFITLTPDFKIMVSQEFQLFLN